MDPVPQPFLQNRFTGAAMGLVPQPFWAKSLHRCCEAILQKWLWHRVQNVSLCLICTTSKGCWLGAAGWPKRNHPRQATRFGPRARRTAGFRLPRALRPTGAMAMASTVCARLPLASPFKLLAHRFWCPRSDVFRNPMELPRVAPMATL